MKFEFFETDYVTSVTLIPETTKEMAQLSRFTLNSKAEKPTVSMSLSDSPSCNIWMKKVEKRNQVTTLSNKKSIRDAQ